MGIVSVLGDEFGPDASPREIPIDSVVIVEGTYPRLQVDDERVCLFRELFGRGGKGIPPIKVVPLVDCRDRYIFIDGRHRLMGKKFHSDRIEAAVSPSIAFTLSEVETCEVKRRIRLMASYYNARNGLVFTRKELKTNIIELYRMKTPLKELFQLAPERTVRRYLRDEHERERVAKQAREHEIIELRKAGLTQEKIACRVGLSQSAVSKIANRACRSAVPDDHRTSPAGCTGSFHAASRPDGISAIEPSAAGTVQAAEGTKGDLAILEDVYEATRKVKPSKRAEQHIKQYLLPLLAERFPGIGHLIEGAGYVGENALLKSENNGLTKQIAGMEKKNRELQKQGETLRSELLARTNYCRRLCRFSREQYMKEQKHFLDSLLEDIEALTAHVVLMDTACRAAIEHEDSPEIAAAIIADLGSGAKGPGAAPLALRALALGRGLLSQAVSNTAYKFLSMLDYCMQLRHTREDLAGRLARCTAMLHGPDLCTDDLRKRLEECGKTLDNDYIKEGIGDRSN